MTNLQPDIDQIVKQQAQAARPGMVSRSPQAPHAPDLLGHLNNDSGNADRLVSMYGDSMLYCHLMRKWLLWDGKRWKVDQAEQANLLAKRTLSEFMRQAIEADDAASRKFAFGSLNAVPISNMLRLAQPLLAVAPEELDTNPNLLNFKNGTIDLRDGALTPHRKEDRITKLVHYDYSADAKCPLFERTLAEFMGNDADAGEEQNDRVERLVSYLQRAFGYSLTGIVSEKNVFFCWGEKGNNGKTTLLTLFRELLKEYSSLLQVDTLMISNQSSNNAQADTADLRGARFVMTSEGEEGQRISESKIKQLTQGMGSIKAARKHENPIEFPATHKVWFDSNHKPKIRGTDNAMWNRIHLIPFDVTLPSDRIDRSMPERLRAEAEGILAWAVRGAQQWASRGLDKPAEVSAAVEQYRDEQDQVGRFIEECCVQSPNASAGATALYNTYRRWTESVGERYETQTKFGLRLTNRGIRKQDARSGMIYLGVSIENAAPTS